MNRNVLSKTSKYTLSLCIKMDRNLIPLNSLTKCQPNKPCGEPNEEMQLDVGVPIYDEKNQEIFFLACIDRISQFSLTKVYEYANAYGIQKFLRNYILLHSILRRIRFDQARYEVGKQICIFCEQHNIEVFAATINDLSAIGLA